MRKIYLSNMDPDEALALFLNKLNINPVDEEIHAVAGAGRVTSEPVFATVSSPNFNASAMDGAAVVAEKTFGADERNPALLVPGDFEYVDTGDVIKEPYNAVVMIEDIQRSTCGISVNKPVSPWQHVRPMGEDIVAHEMVVPARQTVRPVDIGAMLSGGVQRIYVYKRPSVGIIPTGDEIVEPGCLLKPGDIIESNSRVFEALTEEYGGTARRYGIVSDDFTKLKDAVAQAVKENDIVLVNAGSSAGSEDYTAPVIESLGEVLVHGIAAKPGKPAILGIIGGKPVIGIPGYPVSAYYVYETFVKPLIFMFQGKKQPDRLYVDAVVSRRVVSSLKHREYVPVKLGDVNNKIIATPINRGAGVTMSLVRADGLLIVEKNSEGHEAGENAQVELFRDLENIAKTLVCIGSHDLIMDVIASDMRQQGGCFLSSSHVGSMGGIMALKRGEAHVAPVHLLDSATGVYNVSFIKRYLSGKQMLLVKGVKREQGFIVRRGNPKNIRKIDDLINEGVIFVNRQNGSGTRLLVDYLLSGRRISPEDIEGYQREMATHMAVGACVLSGSADVGVGVYSVAKALDLDFIPIGSEDYDFAMEKDMLGDERVKEFLNVLTGVKFKEQLASMGGYKTDDTGEVIYI